MTALSLPSMLLTAAALFATGPPAASAAAPPPELAPLLQKTAALQINTERFTGEVTILPRHLPRKLKDLGGLKLKLSGEESVAPEAAAVTSTIAGEAVSLVLADDKIYLHEPGIAKLDGGRPWIELDEQSSGKLFGSNPSLGSGTGLGGTGGGISQDHFKLETALLKASKDVRPLGPSTIDGQAVTGFAGTADPKQIEETHLSAKLRAEVRKSHVKPAASFEIFLAPNGLPVRSNIVLVLGKVKLEVSADVLAINYPVVTIAPPPPTETVTAADLEELVKKHAKKKR
jgi:hypothetical protein